MREPREADPQAASSAGDARRFVRDRSDQTGQRARFFGSLLVIGAAAGLVSSFLGVGGGIVMVPLLVQLMKFPQHAAHATSMGALVLIAGSGFVSFGLAGEVDYGYVGLLIAGGVIGAHLGARAMDRLSPDRLSVVFAVVLMAVGVRMLT